MPRTKAKSATPARPNLKLRRSRPRKVKDPSPDGVGYMKVEMGDVLPPDVVSSNPRRLRSLVERCIWVETDEPATDLDKIRSRGPYGAVAPVSGPAGADTLPEPAEPAEPEIEEPAPVPTTPDEAGLTG